MYSKVFLILRKATTKVYALGHFLGVVDDCTIFHSRWYLLINILREKSLAIHFEDSQIRKNRTFNFIVSKTYVDKHSRVR